MELNEKEKEFFEDEKFLKKRYSQYYFLLEPLFKELIKFNPKQRERILYDLKCTKVSCNNQNMHSQASTIRIFEVPKGFTSLVLIQNKRYNQKLQLVNPTDEEIENAIKFYYNLSDNDNLNNIVVDRHTENFLRKYIDLAKLEKEVDSSAQTILKTKIIPEKILSEYHKQAMRTAYIHEMLHALAHKKICYVEDNKFVKINNIQNKKNDSKLCIFYGANPYIYLVKFDNEFEVREFDNHSMYKEEAIVEDWAVDMLREMGGFKKLEKEYYTTLHCTYSVINYLAGLINIAFNGEWRNQLLTGNFGEKVDLKVSNELNNLFDNFIISIIGKKHNTEYFCKDINAKQVCKSWIDLIRYCDEEYLKLLKNNQLSLSQQEKYLTLRASATNEVELKRFLYNSINFYDIENLFDKTNEIITLASKEIEDYKQSMDSKLIRTEKKTKFKNLYKNIENKINIYAKQKSLINGTQAEEIKQKEQVNQNFSKTYKLASVHLITEKEIEK